MEDYLANGQEYLNNDGIPNFSEKLKKFNKFIQAEKTMTSEEFKFVLGALHLKISDLIDEYSGSKEGQQLFVQ